MSRARLSERTALHALAARVGIVPEYVDQTGAVRTTADATRIALLAAMGCAADTEARARAALRRLESDQAGRLLAPARVVRAREARALPVRLARQRRATRLRWVVDVSDESGATRHAEGVLDAGAARVVLPFTLAPGYYSAVMRVNAGGEESSAQQTLVVTPGRCARAPARRVYGMLANLYTVRSARNWGAGDLTDLADVVRFTGEIGGAFVGINPLHALGNVAGEISPYSPVTRLYRNPLYLDVTAVPELLECPEAQARLAAPATRAAIAALRAADRVEYEAVMDLKHEVLRALHRTFVARHRGRRTARGEAYARYRDATGESLVDFATFLTLREELGARDRARRDWQRWPARYRERRAADMAAFRAAHGDAVDYHCWLQFELDRQLGTVAQRARDDGLAVGVYQDLALGSSPSGADPWMYPGLFLRDRATIGAPPDPFAPDGQNWGLPPVDPLALARDGFRYWIQLVRAAFRHAGALRIDHVMGLFRQFWIPAGLPGSAGAYVRMPAAELLGIVALESTRARAPVIGEDLGTVPSGLPRELARWGVLSMRVLYFARDARGRFVAARRYPRRALASVNTHDTAPLAGWWQGRDLELRRRAGQITSDDALAAAERDRDAERAALVRRLRREGVLRSHDEVPARGRGRGRVGTAPAARTGGAALTAADLCAAAHAFLSRSPAALVGLSLDDLAGELDPVNLPGVGPDAYPSWSRKMRREIGALATDVAVRRLLGDAPALRGTRRRRGRQRALPPRVGRA